MRPSGDTSGGPVSTAAWRSCSPRGSEDRTRAASLVNAGVLERTTSDGFDLSDAARFSLLIYPC